MGEMLCGGHWNDRNLGNVWCTNCTCFWFPPQLMAVWPWHPGKFLPISGGQSARRYICSKGCRTGMVQILTVIGWHQAPGMRHAAGHLPSVSASEHWDTLLESFWTPHQQLACFLWPWPVWAHFLMCRARVLTFGVRDEALLLVCLWPYYTACGIFVPRLGIEPTSPAVEGRVLTTGLPGKSWSFLHQLLPCSPELGTLLTIKFFSRSTLPQNGWWRKFRLFGLIFKAIYHLFTQAGFMDRHLHWA